MKHFKAYHNTNFLWTCRGGGCGLSFDLQSAYKLHLNDDRHPNGPLSPGEDKVQLQPQVVFACGFTGCKEVYEIDPMDPDVTQCSKDYFSHVIDHMKKTKSRMAQCPWEETMTWSYTTRMGNLLRQSQVRTAWKALDKELRNSLSWQIQNSTVLRKKLECRDVKDIDSILQAAKVLGSRRLSHTYSQNRPTYMLTLPTIDDAVASKGLEDHDLHKNSGAPLPSSHISTVTNPVRLVLETPIKVSRQASFRELDHMVVPSDESWLENNASTPSLASHQDLGVYWDMHHPHMHEHVSTYAPAEPTYGYDLEINTNMATQWHPSHTQWYDHPRDVAMGSPPR